MLIALDYVKSHLKLDDRDRLKFEDLLISLPQFYKKCRGENTVKKYDQYFKFWRCWAKQHEVDYLPANHNHVGLYLLSKLQAGDTFPTIDASFYAIKFYHKSLYNVDPCKHNFVKNILEVAKRISKSKIRKKKALSQYDLNEIYKLLRIDKNNLADQRLITIILTAFYGFMRFSEVANIRRSDIIFKDTFVKIFIEKSKTDIYRDGMWIHIAACSNICPVAQIKEYLALAKIKTNSSEFIFRAISRGKRKTLRKKNSPISYSRVRELFIEVLKRIGKNWREYGLHSLRSGGATLAANQGVPDRLFKRHGRWKSDKAKDGYIEDDVKKLLSVTKNLICSSP